MLPQYRWLWALTLLLASGGAGLLYNLLFVGGASMLAGLVYALAVGGTVLAFVPGLALSGVQTRLRRLPALVYMLAAELLYVVLITLGCALGGLVVWTFGLTADSLSTAVRITPRFLAYSLAVSALLVFVMRMRDLIGGEVFVNFMIG
ncbi:MAG: adenylate/guanylate cyclase domain-containing protein, partial [Sphingomonadaceae bacterium]